MPLLFRLVSRTPLVILLLAAVGVGSLIAPPPGGIPEARAGSLRCKKRLIARGNHLWRVLKYCGDPDYATQRSEYRTVRVRHGPIWQERTIEVVIDEWTYDLGPNRLMRHLYFENQVLLHVETGERGD